MPSSNIDKRIVEMDFDNARFEKNCAQSISTLDKLKNALNLGDAAKGFNQLEKQANNVDFSGLERSISNIEHRFSALGIAGATIVSNLTNKAIGAVSKINSAVFGQMKSGGISRALNLEHANFMMEGLLKDSAKVAEIMATDGPVQKSVRGTAYGLDAAASAAAQFLASGVTDLGKLENALTGISGVASMAGSSFEDIASIFTTVAGQGKVMTMQLRQLEARSLNPAATLAEHLNKSEAEIRDMVTKGKIDFETFAEAMNEAFGDQAKKANETFTGVMANVKAALSRIGAKVAAPTIEELRKIFVDLISVVDGLSKALDPLIEDINFVVGEIGEFTREILENEELVRAYTNFIEGLRMAMYDLASVIGPIKQAFTDIFPTKSLSQIADLFELFKRIASVTYLSATSSEQLRRIFRGLFSIVDILGQAFGSVLKVMLIYSDQIGSFVHNVLEAAATVGDFFNGLRLWIRQNDIFTLVLLKLIDTVVHFKDFVINSFNEIKNFFAPFTNYISSGINSIVNSVSNLEGSVNIIDKIKERLSGLTSIGKIFGAVFNGIKSIFKEMSPIFKAFAEYIGNGISTLFNGIAEIIHSGKGFEGLLDLINTVLIGGIGAGIASFIDQIVNITKKSNTLIGNISWTFKELAGSLSIFQAKIKADMLASIAKSVGILTLSIIGLSLIDSDKLTKALMAITVLMGVLAGARIALAKFIPVAEMAGKTWYEKIMSPFNQTMQMGQQSNSILKLAAAIGILAVSLKLISTIKSEDMSRTLGTFVVLMVGLVTASVILSKKAKKLAKVSDALLMLSASIAIIAHSIKSLAKADPKGVAAGTIALGAILGEIAFVLSKVKAPKKGDLMKTAQAISLVAVALGFMEPGLALMAAMDPVHMVAGAGALIGILAGISIALSKVQVPKGGDLMKTAMAISLIAVALGLLAPGLTLMAAMKPENIVVSTAMLALMLATIGAALQNINAKNVLETAAAIGIVALAIGQLAPGLALLAAMDPVGIAAGFGALALLLGEMAVILSKVNNEDAIQTAAAVGIIALSLKTLAPALALLSAIPLPNLGVALLGLAGSLAIIGGAAFLLQKFQLAPILMQMGQSLLMISGSVLLVGAGLLMIGTALGMIGVSGVAAAAGISAVLMAIGSALPTLLTGLAAGIAAFIVALGAAAGSIAVAVGQIIKAVLKALQTAIPEFIKLIELTIIAILEAVNGIVPVIIETVLNIIDSLLASIQAHIPSIVENLTLIFIELINALAYVISTYGDPLADAFISLMESIINTLIGSVIPKFLDFGMEIIGSIVKGIFSVVGEFGKFLVELGGEFLKWIGVPEDWVDKGVELINGFIDGFMGDVHKAIDNVVQFGKDLIDGICGVLKISSPSKIFDWIGEMCDIGAANGIDNNAHIPIESMGNLGDGLYNVLDSKLDDTEGMVGEHVDSIGKAIDEIEKRLTGLTRAQKKAAEAEDTKRNDMQGYNSIEALTRAGQAGLVKTTKAAKESTDALNKESSALGKNTKATGGSSKAKKENEKANDKKTKAINEETEALDEETTAVEDNENEIRDQAEQIEIVTERFKEYLKTFGKTDSLKNATRLTKSFSTLWSSQDKTISDVSKTYKATSKSLTNSFKTINKQVIKFNDSGKYLGRFSKSLYKNSKKIEDRVTKTGKTIMKVMGPTTKVFFKAGNSVEKMVISTTKNVKKLGKQFEAAKNFVNSFNADITNIGDSESFILTLRSIEKYFGANKFKQMTGKVKGYLSGLVNEFDDVKNSMNILAKNVDGVGNVLSKNSKSTAYVVDGFMALAASLYDGSEAANEYETEHARLLFLLENGLATEEEVAEHFQSYVSRIKDALVEYRTSVQENLTGSMDIWSKFNQNLLEEGTDLISNIESQIAGYYNWSNMLMELSKRGLDVNILKILTDEGVSSFGKAKGLLEMTRAELALFTEDYQMSQAVIEHATDTAIAAMANAQTQASLRAAAAQGNKTAQAQLKQSAKNKKAMMDDIKAVADYRVKYNKLTKKQEKEYLKSLTKEQQKEYKKQVKAAKKAQKEQTKLAKSERAKRAEKERLKGIMDSIKAFGDYTEVLKKYQNDSVTLNYLLGEESNAFKDLTGVTSILNSNFANSNDALLAFADTLNETGEDGLTYFEEMAKRVQIFTDEIRNAVKNADYLGTEFDFSVTTSLENIYKNAISNLAGDQDFADKIGSLADKGYNRAVLDYITEKYKSDRQTGLSYINALLKGDNEYIRKLNATLDQQESQADATANKVTASIASTTKEKILSTELENAQKSFQEYQETYDKAYKAYADVTKNIADGDSDLNTLDNTIAELEKRIKKLKKAQKNGTLTAKQKKELASLEKQLKETNKKWDTATSKVGKYYGEAETLYSDLQKAEANLISSQERLNKAQEEYNRYIAEFEEANKEIIKDANLTKWFNNQITSVNKLRDAMKAYAKGSDEFIFMQSKINDLMKEFSLPVSIFNLDENFQSIKALSNLSEPFTVVQDGLINFSETIASFNDDDTFEEKMQAMKAALEDYQDSLKDSIRSSSDFFSMFKGFSDENNPLTIGKYLEYANSQVTALKEWSSMLMRVTDLGLNKDLVENLANQGLGSYEQLYALTNATADEIAQYNYLWEEYNKEIEKSTNAAMASIAAAWSDAGKNLQSSMIQAFVGSDEFEEAGYEASALVITGMKNGLEGGMTTIISAVEKNMSSTEMATSLGKSVGKSINEGLVQSIQTSVQDTVDAAIEKFKMAVDSVNEYVNATLQTEFTITVHVDTTEIDEAVARMNAAVSGINADARTTSQAVTASQTNQAQANVTATPEPTQVTNNVTFNQTNNSPKSLSQVDIYRNTKNQLNQTAVALGIAGS